MPYFLGIDVGSVSTKLVVIDETGEIKFETYLRTEGGPIQAIQKAFRQLNEAMGEIEVAGVGTTGSGRRLAGIMVGADVIKNEITAHATAARWVEPNVRTVIDIGGQDSKIIFFQNGVPVGFNMNTVCAAGTGSFLDHQATRLGIPIEEFGEYALRSKSPIKIAGRCGVFAESDLIHKQQMGYKKEDLIAGLCLALATNFLANVARGRKIEPVVLFQGGVAANVGMRAAFEKKLGLEIVVPPHFKVMGAWGAALLAKRNYERRRKPSNFRGVKYIASFTCTPRTFICGDCANNCEVNEVYIGGELVSRWGSRCGKWNNLSLSSSDRPENRWDSGLSLRRA
ncbi:acyl-CoA dehydratase activase [Ammonifex thiophilus]|uniref:2-hydroxyglutaryl-CoA dehydratase n=1 Tax=Ammonifex thiophilus TaxID=444093 RepID=A0A3D8P874_9THEO|nr:acyl-CoA dehydratase activase [Ammonifex thiophilus]RDV84725.1 2-hydroxyglutaryl-CoA dehydratase [Ammonifex thiophilus]